MIAITKSIRFLTLIGVLGRILDETQKETEESTPSVVDLADITSISGT